MPNLYKKEVDKDGDGGDMKAYKPGADYVVA